MSTQYKVVSSPRLDRFETTITGMLNEGWVLEGSVFVSSTGAMAQALTKRPEPWDKKTTTTKKTGTKK